MNHFKHGKPLNNVEEINVYLPESILALTHKSHTDCPGFLAKISVHYVSPWRSVGICRFCEKINFCDTYITSDHYRLKKYDLYTRSPLDINA